MITKETLRKKTEVELLQENKIYIIQSIQSSDIWSEQEYNELSKGLIKKLSIDQSLINVTITEAGYLYLKNTKTKLEDIFKGFIIKDGLINELKGYISGTIQNRYFNISEPIVEKVNQIKKTYQDISGRLIDELYDGKAILEERQVAIIEELKIMNLQILTSTPLTLGEEAKKQKLF